MSDHLLAQIVAGIFAIIAAALGVVSVRRRFSTAAVEGARDAAESGLFETTLLAKDQRIENQERLIDLYRTRLDETMQTLTKVKTEARHRDANRALQLRLLRRMHPEVDISWLREDSRPAPLSTPPALPPQTGGDVFDTDFQPLK